jgi:UPF0755 protein
MPANRSALLPAGILILVALLCVSLLFAGNFLLSLPQRAAELFGPPAENLSPSQQVQLAINLLWQADLLTQPLNPLGQDTTFEVQPGETSFTITTLGLIPSAKALRTYLIFRGFDTRLKAGTFTLSPAWTPMEIAQRMMNITPSTVLFRIFAGWRLEEIAASLPTSGLNITPEEFIASANDKPVGTSFATKVPEASSLEGFLFPGVYEVPRQLSVNELISLLLKTFDYQVTLELRRAFRLQGLTLYKAVTLASIVQREAVVEEEMPLVASVYLNRLAQGMKLDADPTVQYALGYNPAQQTWWTNPLSIADLQVDSPYNTYLYPGLPPGPISNPGLPALTAVAHPADTPFLYFRVACDGSGRHNFATSYKEHLANACR